MKSFGQAVAHLRSPCEGCPERQDNYDCAPENDNSEEEIIGKRNKPVPAPAEVAERRYTCSARGLFAGESMRKQIEDAGQSTKVSLPLLVILLALAMLEPGVWPISKWGLK